MIAWLRKTAVIWLVGSMTLLANLGGPRLWDRDEPRNAGCAEEMLAGNDWIVPRFNGELRTHKPVLLYWAMMAADQLPIDREFAARLPSALCGIGTLIVTFLIGHRIYGESTGRLAALILASSIMFVVAGRAATPDATLTFLTTLALYLFVCAAFAPLPPGKTEAHATLERGWQVSTWNAMGMYSAMALAVLAKGPVGFVLPWTVVIAFTLLDHHREFVTSPVKWHRRCGKWLCWLVAMLRPGFFLRNLQQLRPVFLIVAMAAIALPWYVWVGLRTNGDWLR
ncbi:MAG: glycosyltransferase family 39 protein, partial [Planctomycetota bacterium]|nr:glycosyltransferase family 39 protein [Planctomycetota bacterium]